MNIGVIIQASIGNATKTIAGVPTIRRCIEACFKFPVRKENIVLAVPWTTENKAFRNHLCFPGGNVKIHYEHEENLMQRIFFACLNNGLDVIFQVNGNNPVPSWEIATVLLKSHLETGADFTEAEKSTLGIGCQVWNVEALGILNSIFPNPKYSEHMSEYTKNNPGAFSVNRVKLPPEYITDHRLTIDYPEDLRMFKMLFARIAESDLIGKFDVHDVFQILNDNPEIAAVNSHRRQAILEPGLIEKIKQDSRIRR